MAWIRQAPVRPLVIAALGLAMATAAVGGQLFSRAQLLDGNPDLAKVSSHLLRARVLGKQNRSPAQVAAAVPTLQYRDGLPAVAIRLRRLTPAIVEELRGRGLEIDSYHEGYARAYGRVNPADLDKLAALDEVITIQPMPRRGTRAGAAENQADVTMNADEVRDTFFYDGTGVEVGILSDSFNDSGGGTVSGTGCFASLSSSASQASNDLPSDPGDVVVVDDCTLAFCSVATTTPCLTNADCPMDEVCEPHPNCLDLIDEGRAIGELIFDIAPAATFSFHSAFNSPADFADGITELVGCGADLIVDDIFWTGQAFFQDGIIAQAAQAAVDAGVPYFSAAGDDATFGIDDGFVDPDSTDDLCALTAPDGHDLHDFGDGDQFAGITIPEGCNLFAELQWDQPFETIGSSPGSATDLNLWLLDSPVDPASVLGANIVEFSTTAQGGGPGCAAPPAGDPIEQIFWENDTGGPATVFLAVEGCCVGAQTDRFRIVTLSFNCDTLLAPWDFEDGMDVGAPDPSETPIFVDPQIFGHPAARDVIAVGAAFFREIDLNGDLDPPPAPRLDVEAFSSLGGDLPFLFDEDGDPLPGAPELRFKPEVVGPDGTNTTFFGTDLDDLLEPSGDSDPNFFGTSAAAANSAAIAALILDATDLKINPLPLKELLRQSALDMEDPGLDPYSGDGFTDAIRPIRSLDPNTTPLVDDLEFDLDGGAFFSSPPTGGTQRLQALGSILYENGDFSGIDGLAVTHIFADGFESGDTSAWSNSPP